ncbi:MAG: hypothetical protein EOP00_25705 [Pedobacter sp.]|nr:MAG: hypothetical protein EOP00_25705 [Pedobacter sp.]
MEKNELLDILNSNFQIRWKELSNVSILEYAETIESEFLIDEMLTTINSIITSYNSYRYQRSILRALSMRYAMLLYLTSDNGTNIQKSTIIEAQRLLKIDSACKIYPCTRLFN